MKRAFAFIVTGAMALSLAACGGNTETSVSEVKSSTSAEETKEVDKASKTDSKSDTSKDSNSAIQEVIDSLSGEWFSDPSWLGDEDMEYISLSGDTITIDDEKLSFTIDNEMGFDDEDSFYLITEESEDDTVYNVSIIKAETGDGYEYHEMSIFDDDYDYFYYFISEKEFSLVNIDTDNWSDYLHLSGMVLTSVDDFDEVDNFTYNYVLTPFDVNYTIYGGKLAIGYDYSDYIRQNITYDSNTGECEFSEYTPKDDYDKSYYTADSETTTMYGIDLQWPYDISSGLLYTYVDDFENNDGICTGVIDLPDTVEITKAKGYVVFTGQVSESDSKAKTDSDKDKDTKEKSKDTKADTASVKDKDGYSVRAFNMDVGDEDFGMDEFVRFYYDPDKNVLCKVEAVIRMEKTEDMTEDMYDDVSIADIMDCEEDSLLSKLGSVDIEEDDDYLYINILISGLDDPDNEEAVIDLSLFDDDMLNEDGTVNASEVLESFESEYTEVDPETYKAL